jgi:hypothetical protein
MTREQALAAICPQCGAASGERCKGTRGRERDTPHRPRTVTVRQKAQTSNRRSAWKEREAQGLIIVQTVEDETDLVELLIACGHLPEERLHNVTRREIERAVEGLHARLITEHKASLGNASPQSTLKFAFIEHGTDSHQGDR